MQREDPADAPLKIEVKPSSYHKDAAAKARDRLTELLEMVLPDINVASSVAFVSACDRQAEIALKTARDADRFLTMLVKIREWEPPTPEHEGLKKFAIYQIEMSIDSYEMPAVDRAEYEPKAWYARQVAAAEKDIEYHHTHYDEEVARCAGRTEWLTTFVESLPEEPI